MAHIHRHGPRHTHKAPAPKPAPQPAQQAGVKVGVKASVSVKSGGPLQNAAKAVGKTVGKAVGKTVNRADAFTGSDATKALRAANGVRKNITKAVDEFKQKHPDRPLGRLGKAATQIKNSPVGKAVTRAANSPAGKALGHTKNAVSVANDLVRLPGLVKTAGKNIRTAIKDRSAGNVDKALKSSRDVGKVATRLAEELPEARKAVRAGVDTFKRVAPKVSAKIGGAAARVANQGAVKATKIAAQKVGEKALVKGATRFGAKAAGRFVPGANVAIAALDTARFANTLRDPKASTGKKVLTGITALGSIAAATNIPVVSQVGAAVSTVSSALTDLKLPKIKLPKIKLPKIKISTPW